MAPAPPELLTEDERVASVRAQLYAIQQERFTNELAQARQGAKPEDPSPQPGKTFKQRADDLNAEEKRICEAYPELVGKIES